MKNPACIKCTEGFIYYLYLTKATIEYSRNTWLPERSTKALG